MDFFEKKEQQFCLEYLFIYKWIERVETFPMMSSYHFYDKK